MDGVEQKKETRGIAFTDKEGKKQVRLLEYTIVLKNGKLLNVINKLNYSVEKNSDTFSFFSKKYAV